MTDTRPGEVFAFTYDKRNRPSSITRNSVAYATYGYNALEQLVARSTSAPGGPVGLIHYIYDRDGHLIAEADSATGTTARDYIWAAANDNTPVDLPLAIAESAVITMVHTDHLGRPTRMTDAAKATVWQASFKPWGEVQSLSGTKAINLRFPGQYFQIETNLAYNHHRIYDPTTGRYTQPDPLGFVDGPSVYAYVRNSPFMFTNRSGLAGRYSVPCGNCTLIYDADQWKGAHTHWQCPGQSQGCIKKDGALCDGSAAPPANVLQCLKEKGRVPQNCDPSAETPSVNYSPWIAGGAAVAAGVGVAACIALEPCGAILGGSLAIGGGLVVVGQ